MPGDLSRPDACDAAAVRGPSARPAGVSMLSRLLARKGDTGAAPALADQVDGRPQPPMTQRPRKYEHLYRATIGDGNALAIEVNLFRHTCNTPRPHQAPGERTRRAAYLAAGHCDQQCGLWRTAT